MHPVFAQLSIDPHHASTLAQQIKLQIVWLIVNGQLKAGDRLPNVRELAGHLAINLHTVRSAYHKLAAEGLVEIRQGRGTVVLPFEPQRIARAASSLRSHTVGVILPSWINPFYHNLLAGIEAVADEDHTLIYLCNTHDDPARAWRYFAQLSAKQVDGVLVVSHDISELLPAPAQTGGATPSALPYVTIDWPDSAGYQVLVDLEGAGYQAARHLLAHGHTHLGLITFNAEVGNVRPVNAGFLRAIREASLPVELEAIARVSGFDIAAGVEGMRRLLQLNQPPTAVFAISDLLAIGALQALKSGGWRIPADMAVVGFNDIPLAAMVDPPLTSVSAPAFQMGSEAMKMLQKLIVGSQPVHPRLILRGSLVVRQSCGCNPAA